MNSLMIRLLSQFTVICFYLILLTVNVWPCTTSEATFGPYLKSNKLAGYQIADIKANNYLRMLRFEPHDIITHVNQQALIDHDLTLKIWKIGQSGPRMTAILIRQGQKYRVTFQMDMDYIKAHLRCSCDCEFDKDTELGKIYKIFEMSPERRH